jgi:hypothetical protein
VKTAEKPFQFYTASYLSRVGLEKSANLAELLNGLERCSDASIFYHTFQSLDRHHYLTEGFSNDFAQWVLAACNQHRLAESLGGLDIRGYLSLSDLRADLRRIVGEFCEAHAAEARQNAFEPFYFRAAIEVTMPVGIEARTLQEFRDGINQLSRASLYFHFISSRLRLHLRTNDFSLWLTDGLGMAALGQKLEQIDIYTNTMEGVREKVLALIDRN